MIPPTHQIAVRTYGESAGRQPHSPPNVAGRRTFAHHGIQQRTEVVFWFHYTSSQLTSAMFPTHNGIAGHRQKHRRERVLGNVIKFRRRHARGSKAKSSRVTRPPLASLIRTASSFSGQDLPRLMRDIVERSQPMISDSVPSVSSRDFIQSESFMSDIVQSAHNNVKTDCALDSVAAVDIAVHNAQMQPHFMRKWRKRAGLNQTKAAIELGFSDHSQLSRIERAVEPWNQRLLENAAALYGTTVCSLLYVDPDLPVDKALQALVDATRTSSEPPKKIVRRAHKS